MNRQCDKHERFFVRSRFHCSVIRHVPHVAAILLLLLISACSETEKLNTEPYYAKTSPPVKQEFRWSNGKTPKSLDPVKASAPPETDVVRALYEGLTEIDPKTLQEIPAAAERWTAGDDFKIWTFYLRADAKWSNGKPVIASDFVRSWTRVAKMGDEAVHAHLLNNIVGLPLPKDGSKQEDVDAADFLINPQPYGGAQGDTERTTSPTPDASSDPSPRNENNTNTGPKVREKKEEPEVKLGFTALSERVFQINLVRPDKDLPKLVAHPIFRPVFGETERPHANGLDKNVVTNGAFRIAAIDKNGITVERSENYWNREAIKLETVRFVPKETAEMALEAYRAGELDAISNAEFAPLALKLLAPYADFRKTTHSALNFYEFNVAKPPFSDRRVREALSIAIERERLTEGEMEGVTQPALSFMPFGTKASARLTQDKEKARSLMDQAGFLDGEGFPVIRLLVNRNETQQRVARSVAEMWKRNLNLNTEIIVKEPSELEAAREIGDFDIVRRGIVLPTSDESVNFMAIFGFGPKTEITPEGSTVRETDPGPETSENSGSSPETRSADNPSSVDTGAVITNEEDALFELRAMPLYFPTSYSLVKPYVSGFEMNSLDAPALWNVVIDNDWQPNR